MTKKRQHILKLVDAMLNKKRVSTGPDWYKHDKIIQHINLDGECTIYSNAYQEITEYDVPALNVIVQ